MLRKRLHSDEGIALVYVLFASMIISGLVAIFLARTVFESRSTNRAQNFESSLHAGEAGAESLFGLINTEGEDFADKVITAGPTGSPPTTVAPHRYDPPSGLSDSDLQAWEENWVRELAEADWELSQADASYESGVVPTDDGQAFGVRPENASGSEAMDVVFGVGFVPSIDHANRQVRVVKMRINRYFFSPDHAVLTGGDLTFGGNAEVLSPGCDASVPDSCNADVHSNGDVSVSGSSHEVQGNFTSSGTFTGIANTTGGSSAAGEEEVPVPSVKARDFYNRDVTYNVDPGGQTVNWYDLCPTGVIKAPGVTPCTGDQVWPAAGDTATSFRGWKFKNGAWEAQKVEAGIFYVYHADASVNGSAGSAQRAVTILVETDSTNATTAAGSGSLEMAGNPNLGSALPDVLFIADRDLKLKGTAGGGAEDCDPDPGPCDTQNYAGFIFVKEQVDVSGTVALSGALISEDYEDVHGLVKRNTAGLNGTMILDFDDSLELDLRGRVTVEYWNEL